MENEKILKPYVVISGYHTVVSLSGDTVREETLIGFIDPNNKNNCMSVLDLFKHDDVATDIISLQPSISLKILYNLGLTFTVTPISDNGWQTFTIKPLLREHINKNTFKFVTLDANFSIWDSLDENYNISQEFIDGCNNAIGQVDFDTADILTKFANDIDTFLNDRYAFDGKPASSIKFVGYMNDMISDISNFKVSTKRNPRRNTVRVMNSETSEIPLDVPSYYELSCTSKFLKKESEIESKIDYNEDEADDERDTNEMTSLFSDLYVSDNVAVLKTYSDIYEPYYFSNAVCIFPHENDLGYDPVINLKNIKVDSVTKWYNVYPAEQLPADSFNLKEDGNNYTLKDLIGNPANNSLQLQNNEYKYYTDLVELMYIGVAIENNAISPEEFNKVIEANLKSKVVENYLMTLAEEAFNINWVHTATTQFINGIANTEVKNTRKTTNDDDENTPPTESIYSIPCRYGSIEKDSSNVYKFKSKIAALSTSDGSIDFKSILNKELSRLNSGFDGSVETGFIHNQGGIVGFINSSNSNLRWVDALIRLLRWGERKPTRLSLNNLKDNSGDNQDYWDLNNSFLTHNDGNINSYNPEINESIGNEYNLVGIITTDLTDFCSSFGMYFNGLIEKLGIPAMSDRIGLHIPIGLMFSIKYENTDVVRYMYEDIYTFIDRLKSEKKPRGPFVYNNGTIELLSDKDTIVQEIDVKNVIESLKHAKDDPDVIYDLSSNAEVEKTHAILWNKIKNTPRSPFKTKYSDTCKNCNIFTMIATFKNGTFKQSMLNTGMEIATEYYTTIYDNDGSLFNPEDARIAYLFLPKFVKLFYEKPQPTIVTNGGEDIAITAITLEFLKTILEKSNDSLKISVSGVGQTGKTDASVKVEHKTDTFMKDLINELKNCDKDKNIKFLTKFPGRSQRDFDFVVGSCEFEKVKTYIVLTHSECDELREDQEISEISGCYVVSNEKPFPKNLFDTLKKVVTSQGDTITSHKIEYTTKKKDKIILMFASKETAELLKNTEF